MDKLNNMIDLFRKYYTLAKNKGEDKKATFFLNQGKELKAIQEEFEKTLNNLEWIEENKDNSIVQTLIKSLINE